MEIDWSVPIVTLVKTGSGYTARFTFLERVYEEYRKQKECVKKLVA